MCFVILVDNEVNLEHFPSKASGNNIFNDCCLMISFGDGYLSEENESRRITYPCFFG